MKAVALVAMLALAACGHLSPTSSNHNASSVKIEVVNPGESGKTYLTLTNLRDNSIGVLVPLFVFSESRYRRCGKGPISFEGHLREVPAASSTDISLQDFYEPNKYVGVFVYLDGKFDTGDHCIAWSENRMS